MFDNNSVTSNKATPKGRMQLPTDSPAAPEPQEESEQDCPQQDEPEEQPSSPGETSISVVAWPWRYVPCLDCGRVIQITATNWGLAAYLHHLHPRLLMRNVQDMLKEEAEDQ